MGDLLQRGSWPKENVDLVGGGEGGDGQDLMVNRLPVLLLKKDYTFDTL